MHIYTHTQTHAGCIKIELMTSYISCMYTYTYDSPPLLLSSHSLPSPLILSSPSSSSPFPSPLPLPSLPLSSSPPPSPPPHPPFPLILIYTQVVGITAQELKITHEWSTSGVLELLKQHPEWARSTYVSAQLACNFNYLIHTYIWIHRLSISTDTVQAWEHETLSSTNHACSCGTSVLYRHFRVLVPIAYCTLRWLTW